MQPNSGYPKQFGFFVGFFFNIFIVQSTISTICQMGLFTKAPAKSHFPLFPFPSKFQGKLISIPSAKKRQEVFSWCVWYLVTCTANSDIALMTSIERNLSTKQKPLQSVYCIFLLFLFRFLCYFHGSRIWFFFVCPRRFVFFNGVIMNIYQHNVSYCMYSTSAFNVVFNHWPNKTNKTKIYNRVKIGINEHMAASHSIALIDSVR